VSDLLHMRFSIAASLAWASLTNRQKSADPSIVIHSFHSFKTYFIIRHGKTLLVSAICGHMKLIGINYQVIGFTGNIASAYDAGRLLQSANYFIALIAI